ncbi:hypothetical protein, conserved [Eimeria tenella]|uniref:Uncharacterized protein n=1 Tax=Eimeria tenella TaxID=5802 RepID=U6KU18_EIMTE|nr:hypothetical protein, conserved [Eimeria tenella]CDJ38980.1 hypothetical protein, conserved [Eimeria tenella]|eukprot:XP_013229735.1 hypothetical protein, conserved [Eimeria tenella]
MPVDSSHRVTLSDVVQYLQYYFRMFSLSSSAPARFNLCIFLGGGCLAVELRGHVVVHGAVYEVVRYTMLLLDGAISKQEQLTEGKLSNLKVFDEKQLEIVEEGLAKRLRPLTFSHVVCFGRADGAPI